MFLILAITLQQSIFSQTSKNTKFKRTIRKILIIFIIFTLVIATAYTSQLYSALKETKYENVVKTVQDLEDSGYNWGAPHVTYIESLTSTPGYTYYKLLSRFKAVDDDQALIRRFYQGKFGLLTEKLARGYILNPTMRAEDLVKFTAMSEDLFWVYTAFMVQKHSVFRETLQMHLLNVMESGLLLYWEHEVRKIV